MTSTDLKIRVYDGYRIRVSVPENTTKMLYEKLYVYCRCRVLRRLPVAALAAAGTNEVAALAAVLLGVSVGLGGAEVSSRRGSLESTPQQNRQNMLKSLQTGRRGVVEL